MRKAWGLGVLLLLGCGGEGRALLRRIADAGMDSGSPTDAGGPTDAGVPDAGLPDAGMPDGGFGRWETLDGPIGEDAQVHPALAVDSSGILFTAYVVLVNAPGMVTTELHVVRWTGALWEPVGSVVASSDQRLPYSAPLWLRLATDGQGRPVVVFGDSGPGSTSGAFPVSAWLFDGSGWQSAPIPGSEAFLNGLALVGRADGKVQLAMSTGSSLALWILEPSGWAPLLVPLTADGGVSEPDLTLEADGTSLVAFAEAPVPGDDGPLRVSRWMDGGWTDLGLPSPVDAGTRFHTPRVRVRADGGVVVAASQWHFEPESHVERGVAVPVFVSGDQGWTRLDGPEIPGGFGLSEPIMGAPIGLQLREDVPLVVSTTEDGGTDLRALLPDGPQVLAPPIDGYSAGSLVLDALGEPVVAAVAPLASALPQTADGGQIQIFRLLPP